MARHGRMGEVELLEPDDASASVDEVARARGAVARGARGGLGWVRRHRLVAAAAVVATAVAVAVPVTLSVRADRARTEALALLPGVLAPMPVAPRVAWTLPSASVTAALTGPERAWVRDDVLVLWEHTRDSWNSLRALDATSGDDRWATALSTAPDLGDPDNRVTDDPTSCAAPTTEPGRGVVVCLVPDWWQIGDPDDPRRPTDVDASTTLVQPAAVRLRAFEAATGQRVLDRPVADGASFVAVGSDVVVAETPESGDGPATLVRLDPSTGAQRWSVDVPRPTGGSGSTYAVVRTFDDEIAVAWLGTTTLVTGDGTVADELDGEVVWRGNGHGLTLDGDLVTQVRDLDTGRVVDLGRSYLAWVGTDDGTVPDTLLVQADERLDALDLTTGMQRWRATSPPRSTLALVVADGTVARLADDGLTVLDAATGSPLWQLSTLPYGLSLVTDGRHLLVLESVPDAGRVVASYDLRDGRRDWEAPIPVAVQRLAVVDHRLFGVGSGGLVAFTSDG